jgi:hypothetical protein
MEFVHILLSFLYSPLFPYGIPTFADGTFGDATFGDRVLWEFFRKESQSMIRLFDSDGANFNLYCNPNVPKS